VARRGGCGNQIVGRRDERQLAVREFIELRGGESERGR
jgi:hypothetical protein